MKCSHRYGVALTAALTAISAIAQTIKVEPVPGPVPQGSIEAHWALTPDNTPLLSWIEPLNGSYALRYSVRRNGQWSKPNTVVAGRRFFRQPAESPALIAFPSGALLAEWVEMPDDSSEAEYIYVSASKDGVRWTAPAMANQDRSPVQHALASIVASGDQEASIIWLEALKGEDGPSELRRTLVTSDGKVIREELLEADVCTCCPTTIVKTGQGLVVAYRGHTPEEIRDIAVKQFTNNRWMPAKILNPDGWRINACPVNGASASARDNRVAIAWFTEAGGKARIQLVFSSDAGATFAKPILISSGSALGHTSAVITEDGGAFVSWIQKGERASRVLARFVTASGNAGPEVQIAEGSTASLGYPRLLQAGSETWVSWGNATDGRVKVARLIK